MITHSISSISSHSSCRQQWQRRALPERVAASSGKGGGNVHRRSGRGQLSLHVSLKPYGFSGQGLREAAAALVLLTGRRPSRAVARTGSARLAVREGRVCGVHVTLRGRRREAVWLRLWRRLHSSRGQARRSLQRDSAGGWRRGIPRSSIPELDRWFQYFPQRSQGRLEVSYRPHWQSGKGSAERSWVARGARHRPRQ